MTTEKRVLTGRLAAQLLPHMEGVKPEERTDGEDKPIHKNFLKPAVKVFADVPFCFFARLFLEQNVVMLTQTVSVSEEGSRK